MTINPGIMSSNTPVWGTPADLFGEISGQVGGFDLDVCALADNAKCRRFFTPEVDGLAQEWAGRVWCNPPYGREIGRWVDHGMAAAADGAASVVFLVPARTDAAWFWRLRRADVRLLPGRLRFVGAGGVVSSAPFPSAVVLARAGLPWHFAGVEFWDWRADMAKRAAGQVAGGLRWMGGSI